MKIGFVGLGKLGFPVALAIESKGHEVIGYDINPAIADYLSTKVYPHVEEGLQPLLDQSNMQIKSLKEVVLESDIVFLPVQTPHDPQYEGITEMPRITKDFDYGYLLDAITDIAFIAQENEHPTILAVISTCLPTTFEKQIKPLLNEFIQYVYTPQFIAMGTVIADYLNPEFALIGAENHNASEKLTEFYRTLFDKPHVVTDVTTAEGIKVSYNTWITAKTVIANIWGEIAYKTGMNFDDIFKAWSLSTKRLISTKYMQAGMSDGGGCHPRDNIALSWLAEELDLSHDIFDDFMRAREHFEQWHGEVAAEYAEKYELPLYILGKAFKPETEIQTGSPAILMSNLLDYPHKHVEEVEETGVYFVATAHQRYKNGYPAGSIVIDPFGIVDDENVEIIKLGRK